MLECCLLLITLIRLAFTSVGNMSGGRCEQKTRGSGLSRKALSTLFPSSQGTRTLLVASSSQPGWAASMIWTRICCIHIVPAESNRTKFETNTFTLEAGVYVPVLCRLLSVDLLNIMLLCIVVRLHKDTSLAQIMQFFSWPNQYLLSKHNRNQSVAYSFS